MERPTEKYIEAWPLRNSTDGTEEKRADERNQPIGDATLGTAKGEEGGRKPFAIKQNSSLRRQPVHEKSEPSFIYIGPDQ